MKTLLLILLFWSCTYSQEKLLNSAYAELLGSGGLYSFNYERMLNEQNSFRIGISYADLSHTLIGVKYTSFPVLMNHFFFSPRNQIELSGGVIVVARYSAPNFNSSNGFYRDVNLINGATYIGYRDWSEESKTIFRIGCSQLFNQNGVFLSGGLSFGYLF
jgi:hypothetical protein